MKTTKVLQIKKKGVKQTYDLTVKNNHNFICNNHVIHNCGYRGEIKAILVNISNENFTIESGERICQAIFSNVANSTLTDLIKIKKISQNTDRGSGGFGHTGNK